MPFTSDTRTETFLDQLDVKWEYKKRIPFGEFGKDWRTINMGREFVMDDDAVEEYAMLMESGSPAPAVLLIQKRNGLRILDGVQRVFAADMLKEKFVGAYVIALRTTERMQRAISSCANTRINGSHTPPKEWMLSHAVELMFFGDGYTAAEISKMSGRPVAKIEDEITFQCGQRQMGSTGYTGKLLSRGKKWLTTQIAKASDESDWLLAPNEIRGMLEVVEACDFKNGQADGPIESFFDVDRRAKRRDGQFAGNLEKLKSHPAVSVRLGAHVRSNHVENILPALRGALTSAAKSLEDGDVIRDKAYADAIADTFRDFKQALQKLILREHLHSAGRKNTSILDAR